MSCVLMLQLLQNRGSRGITNCFECRLQLCGKVSRSQPRCHTLDLRCCTLFSAQRQLTIARLVGTMESRSHSSWHDEVQQDAQNQFALADHLHDSSHLIRISESKSMHEERMVTLIEALHEAKVGEALPTHDWVYRHHVLVCFSL